MTHSLEGKFRGQARWPHSRRRRRHRSRRHRRHRRRRRSNWTSFPLRLEVAVSRVTKQMTFRPVETLFPSQLFTHVRYQNTLKYCRTG